MWLEKTLQSLGHSGNPLANEFLPHIRHFLVPSWYRQLRIKARSHIESGVTPFLSIAPRPDTAQQWQARQQIITEMRNEVDTFGLLEAGCLEDKPEDEETSDDDWDY
jgi:hypothetical protein